MAVIGTKQELIDYCLRNLGAPVLEINVDVDQIDDRVDDALLKYREFHSDATRRTYLKHQVTADDVANGYIPVSEDTLFITKVFPVTSTFTGGGNLFDLRYQMFLNNMGDFINFAGDLSYLYQLEQYLSMIDTLLHGQPQITFSKHENRIYIHGDFEDSDLVEGDYVIVETYVYLPESGTTIWDDMFMRDYTTQLIKRQWGANLMKFEGMQLPGGVIMNGRQLYDDAIAELERLEEKMRLEHELPVGFMVG